MCDVWPCDGFLASWFSLKNSLSLLYIALTRARSYLLVTSSKSFKEFLKFNLEQGHSNVS